MNDEEMRLARMCEDVARLVGRGDAALDETMSAMRFGPEALARAMVRLRSVAAELTEIERGIMTIMKARP